MMRAYLPVTWDQLREFDAAGLLAGPLRFCAVDPRWRSEAPEVDEEEWEFEAQLAAAQSLPDIGDGAGGVVLALDVVAVDGPLDDGWGSIGGPISRFEAAAVLTTDLEWFGVQEIPFLLDP